MRIRNLLVGILVEAILCFSPDRIIAQQTDRGSPNTSETDAVRSREIYKRDCLVCHGANGDGKTDILRDRDLNLPDWTDRTSLISRPDQQLFNVIRFGRSKMPAESVGRADDGEVRGLIRYIRSMGRKRDTSTPSPSANGSRY
jgi:mono/diheme cytochrome c family protein